MHLAGGVRTTAGAAPASAAAASRRRRTRVGSGRKRQDVPAADPLQVSFRPRTEEDDPYILQLTEEQLGSIHQQAFQEPFPREPFLGYLRSGAPTFIVEQNHKRIGYYSYLIGPDARMHISALVIERDHQSEGVGTAVMKKLEDDARAMGVQLLEVFVQTNNERSLAFTRKLGFVEAYPVGPNTWCFQKRLGAASAEPPNRPGAPAPFASGTPPSGTPSGNRA
ncbi:MAG: GNAT family N-acetyltransferase [Alicyclobacillaceae bacterium]|nr:GNAT family N-acetyltransferase [Alicyclobacillaceae bacterium]